MPQMTRYPFKEPLIKSAMWGLIRGSLNKARIPEERPC